MVTVLEPKKTTVCGDSYNLQCATILYLTTCSFLALCVLDWHCTGTVCIGITCSVLTLFVMD